MGRKKNNSKTNRGRSIWIIFVIAVAVYFIYAKFFAPGASYDLPDGSAEIHVIDVGQGDSILVRTADEAILIDAGPGSAEDELENYLDKLGVAEIDYAIFTHPHEDHIGGADMIMEKFAVKNVIIPNVVHTTATFESMIEAIENSDAELHSALYGSVYEVGDIKFTVLAPISEEYEELNDYSVAVRMDYGATSFMFTGDAEEISEKEMLEKYDGSVLDCDFFKVAHHGSSTSNTREFLEALSPDIAAISCEMGNSYGHPHRETIKNLEDMGIEIYRTDTSGTLVFVTDGKEISAR